MARKASMTAAAREQARARARERAAAYLEREQKLVELAADYEVVRLELDSADEALAAKITKIREDAEKRIAKVTQESEEASTSARSRGAEIQQQMLDLGVTRKEAAERLGLPTREVISKPRAAAAAADGEDAETAGLDERDEQ